MAIYRGIGGAGDSTTDATVTAVTEKATEAAASASSAATSASSASTSASNASTSASNASNSASNASTSETNASSSETNAAASASAASTSETNAASSASAASTSETNAASSASAASTSASNASTSETNAASSATAASTSASNAATSESNASTSETNAATSATNAATSETNAATSASNAAASYDSFNDRYLGAKASDPTLDNDGDALVAGALYFNTTDDVMKVYDGSAWVAAYASLSGTLVAVNNLSDVSNVSSSRTNLGLGTAATTASTDYATAAQGALADSAVQTETNNLSTAVTWANVPDANITESSVTQHQAALSITESQISDLQSYLTSFTETNDLSTAVTWANVPDANITQSSVTQHQATLSITESQISDLAHTTSLAFASITSTPTTLTGYGITDAATSAQGALADSAVQPNDSPTFVTVNATTFEPTGDTSTGDNAALGYTSVLGAILTGQGSTNDVTLVNDADATVLSIPTGTTNVAITGDITANNFAGRNRILNGAMVIDQRNAGASITPTNGQYSVDRFNLALTQASKFTVQKNAGSVTPPVGFINYLGATSSSAYSVLSGDLFFIKQAIEGFNTADLAWGTANAKTVTLSFQVYSSLTGTFGGSLNNSAQDRSYPFSYTISSVNTWTSVSVTIAGDTSGTWLTTNGVGIYLQFGLGVGSTYSGTAGAWTAGAFYSATGATSVVGTSGATFYVTGVQLEKGSTATAFDYRPYGTELALCQRYYEKSYNQSVVAGTSSAVGPACGFATSTAAGYNYGHVSFAVAKRAAPTITTYSYSGTLSRASNGNASDLGANSALTNTIGESGFQINNGSGGTLTFTGNSWFVHWTAASEL